MKYKYTIRELRRLAKKSSNNVLLEWLQGLTDHAYRIGHTQGQEYALDYFDPRDDNGGVELQSSSNESCGSSGVNANDSDSSTTAKE